MKKTLSSLKKYQEIALPTKIKCKYWQLYFAVGNQEVTLPLKCVEFYQSKTNSIQGLLRIILSVYFSSWLHQFFLSVAQVFIRIQDSNDNPPIFSQPAYDVSVSEDVSVDMELVRVRASDMDERSRLSFSIYSSVDPASMRLFRVNPGTGVVYTADRLDYEARTQHILTIMVRMEMKQLKCLL